MRLRFHSRKLLWITLKAHREYQGWVPIITVLLGTGMRIGECIGLRWDDLDFEKRIVSVNHTFIYRPDEKQKIGQAYFYTKDDLRAENHSDDR